MCVLKTNRKGGGDATGLSLPVTAVKAKCRSHSARREGRKGGRGMNKRPNFPRACRGTFEPTRRTPLPFEAPRHPSLPPQVFGPTRVLNEGRSEYEMMVWLAGRLISSLATGGLLK